MGRVELGAKEYLVDFVESGQFELTALASGQLAELGCLFGAGVDAGPGQQRVGAAVAEELASHHAEVEVDVMAHEVFGFLC